MWVQSAVCADVARCGSGMSGMWAWLSRQLHYNGTLVLSLLPLVVVNVRSTERHPVCLPIHMMIIVESVTGVAMVPGHVQCVFVAL